MMETPTRQEGGTLEVMDEMLVLGQLWREL